MARRNTQGKKISQLRRSVSSHGRMQPSLGESLALYLRANQSGEPVDYSMYDKEVLSASKYRQALKGYKAYLINGSIVLDQDIDTQTDIRYDGLTKPTLTFYRQTTNLFDLSIIPTEPTGPSGTGAFGTGASGTEPDGTHASGTHPNGTHPSGTGPSGTNPNGTHPDGTHSSGTHPSGTHPSGTGEKGTHPSGTGAEGTYPEGTGPNGTYLSGTGPNGTAPPSSYSIQIIDDKGRRLLGQTFIVQDPEIIGPSTDDIVSFQVEERGPFAEVGPDGFPGPRCGVVLGASSSLGRKGSYIVTNHNSGGHATCWATTVTGTGPFGTSPSGTHPNGTYPSGTGPSGTGASGTGLSGTGVSGTRPSGTGTGPSGTGPSGTYPSGTGPSGTYPNGTRPSGTGPSGTGPNGTGQSGTQPSGTGLDGTGACLTGPAGTKPTSVTGRCDLRFSKFEDGPRGIVGGSTQLGVLTDSSGRKYIQVKNTRISNTGGGSSISDLRTVYIYSGDSGSTHSYTGSSWPYVLVEGTLEVDSEITATITKGSGDELLIDGKPAYQYIGDSSERQANGIFGSWSAFALDGSSETNTLAAGDVTPAHQYETGVTYEKSSQAPFVKEKVRIHLDRNAPSILWYYDDCQKSAGGKIKVKNFNSVAISDDKPALQSPYDNSWQKSYSFGGNEAIILPKAQYNKSEDLIFSEEKKEFSIGFWAKMHETGASFGSQEQYAFDFSNIQGYFSESGTKFSVSGLKEFWGDKDASYQGQNWILESKTGLKTKEWNHYALARNKKEITLYVNGERCDSVDARLAGHKRVEFKYPSNCTVDLSAFSTIGCSRKIEHFLNGKIDDFLLYNIDYYPKFGFIPENSFGSGEFPRREYASFKEGLQAQYNQNIYSYSDSLLALGPDQSIVEQPYFPDKSKIIDRNDVHNFNQSEHYIFPFYGQDVILSSSHEFDHIDPESKPKVTFYKDTGDGPKAIADNLNTDYYPSILPHNNEASQTNDLAQGKYNVVSDLRQDRGEASKLYKVTGDLSGNGYHLIIKNADTIDTGVYTVKYETRTRSWAGQRSVNLKELARPKVAAIETKEPLLRLYVKRSGVWKPTWRSNNSSLSSNDCSYLPGQYNNAQAWKASGYLSSLPKLNGVTYDDINYKASDSGCLAVHIVSTNTNMCGLNSPEELYARIPYNELTGYYEAIPSHLNFGYASGYSLNSVLNDRSLPFCSQHDRPDLCVKIVDECAITGASVLKHSFNGDQPSVRSSYAPEGVKNERVFCASTCANTDCSCPGDDHSFITATGPIQNQNLIQDCYNRFDFDTCDDDWEIYSIWIKIVDINTDLKWRWKHLKDISRWNDNSQHRLSYFDYWAHYNIKKLYNRKAIYQITASKRYCDKDFLYTVSFPVCEQIGPSGTGPSGTGPSGSGPSGTGPSGTGPSGSGPSGTGPSGSGPSGTGPSGSGPSGTSPSGTGPSGTGPSGTHPSGTGPRGTGPSGTGPSGSGPSGTGPSGTHPPSGGGTGPSGTGPSGTGPSGTQPSGTGPSGTGPSGTGPSGTLPSGTGPSGTGPSGTGPSGTGPSGTGSSGTGPSGTGPSGTQPSGTGPSGTGPSGTGTRGTHPSGTHPSGTGSSGTQPSGTGPSGTAPSGTGTGGTHPPSGSGTGPSGTGPSGTGPSGTGPSGTGPSGTGACECPNYPSITLNCNWHGDYDYIRVNWCWNGDTPGNEYPSHFGLSIYQTHKDGSILDNAPVVEIDSINKLPVHHFRNTESSDCERYYKAFYKDHHCDVPAGSKVSRQGIQEVMLECNSCSGTGPSGTGPSGTRPSGTGPSGTGPSGTHPSGSGPSGTGPSGTGPSGTKPSGTGPSGTGPSGTGPSGTGPSGTQPSGTGPSGTKTSGTGPSGTQPSGTGPSGTKPSGTGPSGSGPSGTGPSGTQPSGTGPSGTRPNGTHPPSGSGTGPSGTGPSGTGPSGTHPSGTQPSGTGPSGTKPNGTGPSGTGPSGTGPSGTGSSGTGPSGTGPSGTGPSGTGPSGTGPSGTGTGGTSPSGTKPSGTGPSGTGPSGTKPSGTGPNGTGPSGTGPSGTGPSGTGPSGTGPSGTGSSGTGPSGTKPSGTGPSGTGPSGTGPSGTGPSGTGTGGTGPSGTGTGGTGPSGTQPSGTGPSGTKPSGTGPSGTKPSGTGPSGTKPSGTGPSGTGPSGTGPSGTQPSGTGSSGTGPSGTQPSSGSGTGPSGTGPSGTGPGGTHPGGTQPGGTHPGGTGPNGTQPAGTRPNGTSPGGTHPGGTRHGGTHPGGTQPGGTGPGGTAPGGQGPVVSPPPVNPLRPPLRTNNGGSGGVSRRIGLRGLTNNGRGGFGTSPRINLNPLTTPRIAIDPNTRAVSPTTARTNFLPGLYVPPTRTWNWPAGWTSPIIGGIQWGTADWINTIDPHAGTIDTVLPAGLRLPAGTSASVTYNTVPLFDKLQLHLVRPPDVVLNPITKSSQQICEGEQIQITAPYIQAGLQRSIAYGAFQLLHFDVYMYGYVNGRFHSYTGTGVDNAGAAQPLVIHVGRHDVSLLGGGTLPVIFNTKPFGNRLNPNIAPSLMSEIPRFTSDGKEIEWQFNLFINHSAIPDKWDIYARKATVKIIRCCEDSTESGYKNAEPIKMPTSYDKFSKSRVAVQARKWSLVDVEGNLSSDLGRSLFWDKRYSEPLSTAMAPSWAAYLSEEVNLDRYINFQMAKCSDFGAFHGREDCVPTSVLTLANDKTDTLSSLSNGVNINANDFEIFTNYKTIEETSPLTWLCDRNQRCLDGNGAIIGEPFLPDINATSQYLNLLKSHPNPNQAYMKTLNPTTDEDAVMGFGSHIKYDLRKWAVGTEPIKFSATPQNVEKDTFGWYELTPNWAENIHYNNEAKDDQDKINQKYPADIDKKDKMNTPEYVLTDLKIDTSKKVQDKHLIFCQGTQEEIDKSPNKDRCYRFFAICGTSCNGEIESPVHSSVPNQDNGGMDNLVELTSKAETAFDEASGPNSTFPNNFQRLSKVLRVEIPKVSKDEDYFRDTFERQCSIGNVNVEPTLKILAYGGQKIKWTVGSSEGVSSWAEWAQGAWPPANKDWIDPNPQHSSYGGDISQTIAGQNSSFIDFCPYRVLLPRTPGVLYGFGNNGNLPGDNNWDTRYSFLSNLSTRLHYDVNKFWAAGLPDAQCAGCDTDVDGKVDGPVMYQVGDEVHLSVNFNIDAWFGLPGAGGRPDLSSSDFKIRWTGPSTAGEDNNSLINAENLPCRTTSENANALKRIKYITGNTNTSTTSENSKWSQWNNHPVLWIPNISASEAGKYTCEISYDNYCLAGLDGYISEKCETQKDIDNFVVKAQELSEYRFTHTAEFDVMVQGEKCPDVSEDDLKASIAINFKDDQNTTIPNESPKSESMDFAPVGWKCNQAVFDTLGDPGEYTCPNWPGFERRDQDFPSNPKNVTCRITSVKAFQMPIEVDSSERLNLYNEWPEVPVRYRGQEREGSIKLQDDFHVHTESPYGFVYEADLMAGSGAYYSPNGSFAKCVVGCPVAIVWEIITEDKSTKKQSLTLYEQKTAFPEYALEPGNLFEEKEQVEIECNKNFLRRLFISHPPAEFLPVETIGAPVTGAKSKQGCLAGTVGQKCKKGFDYYEGYSANCGCDPYESWFLADADDSNTCCDILVAYGDGGVFLDGIAESPFPTVTNATDYKWFSYTPGSTEATTRKEFLIDGFNRPDAPGYATINFRSKTKCQYYDAVTEKYQPSYVYQNSYSDIFGLSDMYTARSVARAKMRINSNMFLAGNVVHWEQRVKDTVPNSGKIYNDTPLKQGELRTLSPTPYAATNWFSGDTTRTLNAMSAIDDAEKYDHLEIVRNIEGTDLLETGSSPEGISMHSGRAGQCFYQENVENLRVIPGTSELIRFEFSWDNTDGGANQAIYQDGKFLAPGTPRKPAEGGEAQIYWAQSRTHGSEKAPGDNSAATIYKNNEDHVVAVFQVSDYLVSATGEASGYQGGGEIGKSWLYAGSSSRSSSPLEDTIVLKSRYHFNGSIGDGAGGFEYYGGSELGNNYLTEQDVQDWLNSISRPCVGSESASAGDNCYDGTIDYFEELYNRTNNFAPSWDQTSAGTLCNGCWIDYSYWGMNATAQWNLLTYLEPQDELSLSWSVPEGEYWWAKSDFMVIPAVNENGEKLGRWTGHNSSEVGTTIVDASFNHETGIHNMDNGGYCQYPLFKTYYNGYVV